MKTIEVEWIDSMSADEWHPMSLAIDRATVEGMTHRSIGYLLADDDDMILLAQSVSVNEEMVAATLQIPKFAIINTWEILG